MVIQIRSGFHQGLGQFCLFPGRDSLPVAILVTYCCDFLGYQAILEKETGYEEELGFIIQLIYFSGTAWAEFLKHIRHIEHIRNGVKIKA